MEMAHYAPSLRNTPLMVWSLLSTAPEAALKQVSKQADKDKRWPVADLYGLWLRLSPDQRQKIGPHLVGATACLYVNGSRLGLFPPPWAMNGQGDLDGLRLWAAPEGKNAPDRGMRFTGSLVPGDVAYLLGLDWRIRASSPSKDPGVPLGIAAALCAELREKDALAMLDMLIKGGNMPGTRDADGRLPVDVAKTAGAPASVLKKLQP